MGRAVALRTLLVAVLLSAAPSAAPQDLDKARALAQQLVAALNGPRVIQVTAAADLQAALTAAQPGDELRLTPGVVFGQAILPAKPNPSGRYITIRTDAADALLPPAGGDASPAGYTIKRAAFATIQPPLNGYGVLVQPGASFYKLIGIYIASPGVDGTQIGIADVDPKPTDPAQLPHDIVIDRCWLDGANAAKRGIAAHGNAITLTSSIVDGIFKTGQDTQAFVSHNGGGPFLIEHSYLRASGETILFGGTDPSVPNLVPSDITIRRTYIAKDPAWQAIKGASKNLLELKNARRVLIEQNLFEYSWADAQDGTAVLFTIRNQNGGCSWCTVEDVEFRFNIVRHAANGLSILGHDDCGPNPDCTGSPARPSGRATNLRVHDNLWYAIGTGPYSKPGDSTFALSINDGIALGTFERNTIVGTYSTLLKLSLGKTKTPSTALGVFNNVLYEGKYAIAGDNLAPGLPSWTPMVDSSSLFGNNLLQRGTGGPYKYPGSNILSAAGESVVDATFAVIAKYAREGLGVPLAQLPVTP